MFVGMDECLKIKNWQEANFEMILAPTNDEWSQSQTFIYGGMTNDRIKLTYLEYDADTAYKRYSQNFEISIPQNKRFEYKGFEFDIIEATETSVRFIVYDAR